MRIDPQVLEGIKQTLEALETCPQISKDVEAILSSISTLKQEPESSTSSTNDQSLFETFFTPTNQNHLRRIMREDWEAGEGGVVPQLARALGGCVSFPVRQKNLRIETGRDGNCGYYAYASSLMTYLRFNPTSVDSVFELLELGSDNITFLKALLKFSGHWSPIQHYPIQLLLGSKLRVLAAKALKQQYEADPDACSFVTAFKFKFRQMAFGVQKNTPDDFLSDDLSRVRGMKRKIEIFFKNKRSFFEKMHVEKDEKYIDRFLGSYVKEFFDQEKNLEFYLKGIQENGFWASTEVMNMLHQSITEERREPEDVNNPEGRKVFVYARNIRFSTPSDGALPKISSNLSGEDIILYNIRNQHWVSEIPAKFTVLDSEIVFTDHPLSMPEFQSISKPIKQLEAHVLVLKADGGEVALAKAEAIEDILGVVNTTLLDLKQNPQACKIYIQQIQTRIAGSLEVLSKHRSVVLPVVFSLLVALTGIGLVIGVAQAVYTDGNAFLFWRNQTESQRYSRALQLAIKSAEREKRFLPTTAPISVY